MLSKHSSRATACIWLLTTPEYHTFKVDAINVGLKLEESLSEQAFKDKWESTYDPNTHPIHTGFLISGQGWGKISVKSMHVKNFDNRNKAIVFRTLIQDEEFNVLYDRDIKVVQQDNRFLISDVLEYD